METKTTAGASGSRLAGHLEGRQSRELTAYEKFRIQINKVRKDIGALIGDDKVDKFIRVCLNAAQHNPDVLNADRRTLLLACMEAAQDGLMPDGNEAVLNVYRSKIKEGNVERYIDVVQYLPMAYGLVQTIYATGATFVDAVAVYKEDEFDYVRGDEPKIFHRPYDGEGDPGPVVAAYCVVKYKDLDTKREVMWKREIDRVKGKSKAAGGLMWKDFYDQGAIKSVIHRIFKQLPQAERIQRALAHDNKAVGLSEIAVHPDDAGTDLAALVDMRLETELKDAALNGGGAQKPPVDGVVTGKTVDGIVGGATTSAAAAGADAAVAQGAAATTTTLPKPGDPGTPERKATFKKRLEESTDPDAIDLIMDDIRFFTWDPADLKELTDLYTAQKAQIGNAGSTRGG